MFLQRLTRGLLALGKQSGRDTSKTCCSRGLLSADTHTHTHAQAAAAAISSHLKWEHVKHTHESLTSCVCRFESFLSFGQEAPVGPVQHGFDLVFRIV